MSSIEKLDEEREDAYERAQLNKLEGKLRGQFINDRRAAKDQSYEQQTIVVTRTKAPAKKWRSQRKVQCPGCNETFGQSCFSKNQWTKPRPTCLACVYKQELDAMKTKN